MENQNLKTVRSLSIATLVLSIIWIVATLIICFVVCAGIDATANQTIMDSLNESGVDIEYYYDQVLQDPSVQASITTGKTVVWTTGIFIIICTIFQIIASAIGMGVTKNPKKIGKAFGWGIAGIVFAAFSNTINLILFIILVVKASGAKKQIRELEKPVAEIAE